MRKNVYLLACASLEGHTRLGGDDRRQDTEPGKEKACGGHFQGCAPRDKSMLCINHGHGTPYRGAGADGLNTGIVNM